jgi:hypothetical protein
MEHSTGLSHRNFSMHSEGRLAKSGFHLSPDLVAAVLAELGED